MFFEHSPWDWTNMTIKVANIHLAIEYVTSSTHRSLSGKVSGMMDLDCAEKIEGTGQGRKFAECNGKYP